MCTGPVFRPLLRLSPACPSCKSQPAEHMVNAKPTINKTVNAYRDKGESVAASTICK